MGVQKVPHEIWFTRSLCVSIEPKLPYANEAYMKIESKKTQGFQHVVHKHSVSQANRALARAEAGRFALRTFSNEHRSKVTWQESDQLQLEAIVNWLESALRTLGYHLCDASDQVKLQDE
jgi:hypothetical protein